MVNRKNDDVTETGKGFPRIWADLGRLD